MGHKDTQSQIHIEFISQPVHLSTSLTVEQPEVRNMATEEEEVADDVEMPDYRTLKLNKENVHLFENHSSGMALTAYS